MQSVPGVIASLIGVAYTNNIFVASGSTNPWQATSLGAILISTDGINWKAASGYSSNLGDNLFGSSYINGKFFALGGNVVTGKAVLETSTDGNHWESQITVGSGVFGTMAYGNGKYVAVGISSQSIFTNPSPLIAYSADAKTWETVPLANLPADTELISVTFGNNQFVAVGDTFTTDNNQNVVVLTSRDGINWTLQNTGIESSIIFETVKYVDKQFFVVGNNSTSLQPAIITSPDGITWTAQNTGLESGVVVVNIIGYDK